MAENLTDFVDCFRHVLRHLLAINRLALCLPGLIVLLAVAALAGCGDKNDPPAPPPRPVRTVVVPSPVSDTAQTWTGEIRAHDEVVLGFRLAGRLVSRRVDIGDHVAAGQVLATLEDSTSQNQVASARADLASAQAAEQVAALNLKRMMQLMPSGAIARVQLDTARSDWQAAASRRQSSDAALKTALENSAWNRLTTPVAGVITQVSASPGEVVSAGQSVVTLAPVGPRDAVFDVANPRCFSASHRESLRVSLLTDPGVTASATLRDISPQADPQTRTWRVRVTLDNPPPGMALGASVQVALPHSGPDTMAIPASALTRVDGGPAVFVVDRATRRLALRPITLYRFSDAEMFVTAGLNPGDTVVTAGVSQLRQGEKVSLLGGKP